MTTNYIDDNLRQFATPRQIEFLDAIKTYKTIRKAAIALKIGRTTISSAINALKAKGINQGYSPEHDMTHVVPDGQRISGISSFYDDKGQLIRQWVKSEADKERQKEMFRAAVEAMTEEIPRVKPTKKPKDCNDQLANLYTLTDSHVGMLTSEKENLDPLGNWDLKIAEATLTSCFEHMVKASPKAKVGIVAQLGDFLHSDGFAAVTPTSGHMVDQDGRFHKVVKAAIRILRRIVDYALEHHEEVIVLMAEGNHDLASSIWLRAMFQALYENHPRVKVIDSELPYYVYQHGETMLGWHHGHLKKNEALPILFAAQFPKIWGSTTKRYGHSGHRHHLEIKSHSGMTITQHSTLASRDAYAARGGWMSERECTAITYHKKFGQVCQNTVTPEMLA